MASLKRWRAAQRYERSYWEHAAAQIASGAASQLNWYAWRAEQLAKHLATLGFADLVNGSASVIEIGSGPIGMVAYFPGAARVAVDPLEPFYARDAVLTTLRTAGVQYLEGMGERLPCESSSFDIAIIDNCIDHVRDVRATMAETARVLRPGGVLYLSVNCRTSWGFVVHRMLSRLRIDVGHPHTFTPRRAQSLINHTPLELVRLDMDSAAEARQSDKDSSDRRARLKAFLGTSEFSARLVARRSGTQRPTRAPNSADARAPASRF